MIKNKPSLSTPNLEKVNQDLTTGLESVPDISYGYRNSITQGPITNILGSRAHVLGRDIKINKVTGDATITHSTTYKAPGELTIFIGKYSVLRGLRYSAQRLFTAMMLIFTENGKGRIEVVLPLARYMEICNLKDTDKARIQVNEDLITLSKLRLSFIPENRKIPESSSIGIYDIAELKKGAIFITFASTFHKMLQSYSVMPLNLETFKFNSKRNPNSYYFFSRIQQHRYMNSGKLNEDIISVRTLLECSPLPSYEEVKRKPRQRIIDPFERDMDLLEEKDILTWEYCNPKGEALSNEQLSNLNYHIFMTLNIKYSLKNYPDQTQRLQNKEDRYKQITIKKSKNGKAKK